jgi:hypothetical protein
MADNDVALTVVLNAMGRLELAELGFRPWMLQQWDRPYQIVLSLFNDQHERFEKLTEGKNPNCQVVIRSYEKPEFFNISAANNLGLHFATGEFVMFANSDIVYPSWYGRRFAENMQRSRLGYAAGARFNVTEEQTHALRPASQYTNKDNFDFMHNEWPYPEQRMIWVGCGPWTVRRDVARAIGGFDPAVLVSEDDDISARAVHYLARHGEQDTIVCLAQLIGYHLHHPSSELFNHHYESHKIIDPRCDRLRANPQSTEDIIPNRLDDLDSLIDAMRKTKRPSSVAKYRRNTIRKIRGRVSAAFNVLIGRR